jgi:hypothetical protein
MRAVLLALQHFKTLLVSKAVVLATDNTTVVAYLQNQGERTGEVECEGELEDPHRLENSESPVVERIVEP